MEILEAAAVVADVIVLVDLIVVLKWLSCIHRLTLDHNLSQSTSSAHGARSVARVLSRVLCSETVQDETAGAEPVCCDDVTGVILQRETICEVDIRF